MTIHKLEANDIKFVHIRNYTEDGVPFELGGLTVAFTPAPDEPSEAVWVGLSKCSEQDNFCKRIGRLISQGRLRCGPRDNASRGAIVVRTKEREIHALGKELTNWALKEVYGS